MDAAADMPPIENLWKYTGMGYDLVCFSGGKGIRGPQNAGLLLGKKHLTDLAAANNNPNSDAVGRGMKVAKEQIVGMVAAVDWLLEQNDEALEAEYMRRVDIIKQAVKDVPTHEDKRQHPRGGESRSASDAHLRSKVVGISPKAGAGASQATASVDRTQPSYRFERPLRLTLNRKHHRHRHVDAAAGRGRDRWPPSSRSSHASKP